MMAWYGNAKTAAVVFCRARCPKDKETSVPLPQQPLWGLLRSASTKSLVHNQVDLFWTPRLKRGDNPAATFATALSWVALQPVIPMPSFAPSLSSPNLRMPSHSLVGTLLVSIPPADTEAQQHQALASLPVPFLSWLLQWTLLHGCDSCCFGTKKTGRVAVGFIALQFGK